MDAATVALGATGRRVPCGFGPAVAGHGPQRMGQLSVLALKPVLTRRNPWLSLRLSGSFLLRFAPRNLSESSFLQLPPRFDRFEPLLPLSPRPPPPRGRGRQRCRTLPRPL